MSFKELAEIVDIINEIESLNPRSIKPQSSSTLPKAEFQNQTPKFSIPRKPSLPTYSSPTIPLTHQLSVKESLCGSSRKSLFNFERSASSVNLYVRSSESQNLLQDFDRGFNDFDCYSGRIQPDLMGNIQIYESFLTPVKNEYMNSESLGLTSNYLEMKDPEEFEAIQVQLNIPIKPKNSIDLVKNSKLLRHSRISEKDYRDSSQICSEYNQKLKSAPQSTRNSSCIKDSNHKLEDFSSDSGISSGILINKLGSNILQFSNSNEHVTSSESSFDISDSYPTPKTANEIFTIETDDPTITEKTEETSSSSTKSEKSAELSSIQSEEDKIKFLQKVSKDISVKTDSTKEIIRFYLPNGAFSSQIIDKLQTASSICNLLKIHFNINPNDHWQLIEVIHVDFLDRPLEDHENILEVYYSWQTENTCNRFLFRENPQKYKIFSQPCAFKSEMKCDFEIESLIWVKEVNSKWRKVSCFISDTTVYFKLKPGSKDHKDLYSLVNLKNFDIYSCTDHNKIKKCFKAPTTDLIVFTSNKLEHKSQEHPCICALNSEQRERWMVALKVAKYSFQQLQQNYLDSEKCLERANINS